jgi:alkaline phosphatase D
MNRREFLRVAAGAGLVAPSLLASSGCAPGLISTDLSTGLSFCPMAGDVTDTSALVWLRAEPGSRVALQYGTQPSLTEYSSANVVTVDSESDYTAKISLDQLQPGTRYYYRAEVARRMPGTIGSFVTAPRADDDAKVTFCFSADTRESYKPFTVMNAVRAQRPDFFMHLGDTIYADRNGTAHTLNEFWAKYRVNRDDAWSAACFRETSLYVVWDDHEVADDYLPTNPLAPIGRQAFLDYWPVRCSASEPQRIYRSFQWGRAVELFILDARQYRDLKKRTMLGEKQKQWLLDGLARSSATFKFIVTSVPMAGGGSDRWDGYPRERAELLRYINEKRISGVYFLSGDMHYAAITRIPKSSGLKDITAGPLAAPLNRITNGTAGRFEYYLAENFNFAKITVDPKTDPHNALLEFIDQDNYVFHRAKLPAGGFV